MKRVVVFLLALVVVLCTVTALAYTVPDTTVVWVTAYGEVYHRPGCSHLTGSERSMTIAQAEAKGLPPCSRCRPNILTGKYEPVGSETSTSRATKEPEANRAVKLQEEERPFDWKGLAIALLGIFWPVTLSAIWWALKFVTWPVQMLRRKRSKLPDAKESPAVRPINAATIHSRGRRQKPITVPWRPVADNWEPPDTPELPQEKRQEYITLYEHKAPADLVDIPKGVELGGDGLPKVKGAKGWGRRYTVYISKSGKCFHQKRGCSGATTPIHLWNAHYRRSACSRCCKDLPDLGWYAEYVRIKGIKELYRIE